MKQIRTVGLAALLLSACHHEAPPPAAPAVAPSAALAEHSKEFRKEIIKVTDGVYDAVGFGLANSVLLEGSDGFIVVDTQESVEEARQVNAEFRKLVGNKPLKAIVYTHNHPDHTFGAAGFVQAGEKPEIYAQEGVNAALDSLVTEFRPVIGRRSLRMYGYWLSGDALGNQGIGGTLNLGEGSTISILRPTKTFGETLEDTVAGIHFRLIHTPGETEDTLAMVLPEKNVVLCGDNFYKSFPNLYTIRGTVYRNPRKWADSVDTLRALHPAFLVPGHTRPLEGADNIASILTDYRDAIRYVYDQTVRGMNAGLTADEIAATLKLPARLAASPYLQEFYGKASWSARTVFGGSVGWFDGNPSRLQPLGPDQEAQRWAKLAGSAEGLSKALKDAVDAKDWQWALELSDQVLRLKPGDADATAARVQALTALGEAEANAPARHYYLMSAMELRDHRVLPDQTAKATPEMLAQMPLAVYFNALAVNLDAAKSAELDQKVGFEFSDSPEQYTLWVRRGVAEVQPRLLDGLNLRVKVSAQVFKEMLAQLRNPAVTLAKDFRVEEGSKLDLFKFMALFKPEAAEAPQ